MGTRDQSSSETSTTPRGRRWVSFEGRWQVPALLFAILTLSFLAAGVGRGYLAGVELGDSIEEVLAKVCPGSDACNYLTGGQDLLKTGTISPSNHWILNLWPPGVVVLSALYILIAKTGLSLPVVAGAIGIVAWTLVLSLWFRHLRPKVGVGMALAAVVFVALGQPMRHWYLADGLFYMESLSVALLLGALLALMPRGDEAAIIQVKRGAMAGLLLAAAAYLRAPLESAALVLSVGLAAWFAWRLLPLAKRRTGVRAQLKGIAVAGRALIACVVVVHALTIPWRIVAAETVRPGDMMWSQAGDLAITKFWMPTDYLQEHAAWLVEGTANTPCRVAPDVCQQISLEELASEEPFAGPISEFQSAAVEAWLNDPVDWTETKATAALRFWFRISEIQAFAFEFHENGILLLLLLLTARFGHKVNGNAQALMAALFVASFGISYVFHYEVRYFFPLKSALPLLGVLCVHRALGLREMRQGVLIPGVPILEGHA